MDFDLEQMTRPGTEPLALVLMLTDPPEGSPRHITTEVTVWDEISVALAVTPALAGWPTPAPIPGWWRVTHRPTGMALCAPCCKQCATAVGLALASLPIPWPHLTARASEQLEQLPEAPRLRAATRLICAAASRCTHADPDEETS